MSLKDRIKNDMKDALRAGDKPRLGAIRMILAAVQQREVDERIELDDAQVLAVLDKMVKQRRESIAQYEAAGRDDLAGREKTELEIVQSYLPEPLDESALDALIAAAVSATGASSMKDMGKVMAALRADVQGRADMSMVSARVKARLDG